MDLLSLDKLAATPDEIETVVDRINQTGTVCRGDVQPYIQHFPITIGLENFSEEPSTLGLDIATEAFATLFKVAVGVALVGALGGIVYFLTRSSSAAAATSSSYEKIERQAQVVVDLEKAIDEAPSEAQLKGVKGTSLPREANPPLGESVTLSEAMVGAHNFMRNTLTANVSLFAEEVVLNRIKPLSISTLAQVREYLEASANLAKKIDAALKDVESAVRDNRIDAFVQEVRDLADIPQRTALLEAIRSNYDNILAPIGLGAIKNDVSEEATVLDSLTEQLGQTINDKVNGNLSPNGIDHFMNSVVAGKLSADVLVLKAVATEAGKGRVVNLASSAKETQVRFDKLKRDNSQIKMPAEVSDAFTGLLDSILLDVKSINRLVDVYSLEVNSMLEFAHVAASYLMLSAKTMSVYLAEADVNDDQRRRFKKIVEQAIKAYRR